MHMRSPSVVVAVLAGVVVVVVVWTPCFFETSQDDVSSGCCFFRPPASQIETKSVRVCGGEQRKKVVVKTCLERRVLGQASLPVSLEGHPSLRWLVCLGAKGVGESVSALAALPPRRAFVFLPHTQSLILFLPTHRRAVPPLSLGPLPCQHGRTLLRHH